MTCPKFHRNIEILKALIKNLVKVVASRFCVLQEFMNSDHLKKIYEMKRWKFLIVIIIFML